MGGQSQRPVSEQTDPFFPWFYLFWGLDLGSATLALSLEGKPFNRMSPRGPFRTNPSSWTFTQNQAASIPTRTTGPPHFSAGVGGLALRRLQRWMLQGISFNTVTSKKLESLVAMGGSEAHSVQFSSVTESCLTLRNPMDCSKPSLPVHKSRLT